MASKINYIDKKWTFELEKAMRLTDSDWMPKNEQLNADLRNYCLCG